MKKSELEKIYRKVAEEIGFKKDPVREGWMPKLEPNDYKCKIVYGFTKKGTATLTVGPKGVVDMETLKLAGDYALVEKKNQPCIVLPQVWDVGNHEDRSWVVRERVEGTNPLVDYSRTAPIVDSLTITSLYWNTFSVFSALEEKSEIEPAGGFEDFFRERLKKWTKQGEVFTDKKSKEKFVVLRTVADDMFRYIFYETDLCQSVDLEMRLFFKNFGNTDIVVQGDNFYLPNSEIAFLPQFYGASYFVWNVLMYSYNHYGDDMPEDVIYESVKEEIMSWEREFYESCPTDLTSKFGVAFSLLLFERVIATLLVDIPLRRSPFDVKGQEGVEGDEGARRAQKSEKFFVAALKYLMVTIPTLVENPFKEDIALLGKIYK